jgi:hypothetical protein
MFNRLTRWPAIALALTAAVVTWAPGTARAEPVLPDFGEATFDPGAAIDNTYFPQVPGTVRRYRGDVDDDGETVVVEIEDRVLSRTETVNGVQATVVRAREWENGRLVEDTFDYFAQDTRGNVWYLGEDSTAFHEDGSTSTAGSWRAGANGAEAGFIMPAFPPTIGFNYYQEHAPNDEALDQATIVSLDATATTPAGTFTNVLDTTETSELEPDEFEHKLYARGIGLVLIQEDFEGGEPQAVFALQSVTAIPLPPAVVPGLASVIAAMGWTTWQRRRRNRQ